MSHLFHRLHEQHYVAHVMAYAACVGPSKGEECEQRPAHAPRTDTRIAQPLINAAKSAGVKAPSGRISPGVPNFPTLSPVLQQLLNDDQQKVSI